MQICRRRILTTLLFVNMSFTKEDKILIKNLLEIKGYNTIT